MMRPPPVPLTPTAATLATLARRQPDTTAIVEDGMAVDYHGLVSDLDAAIRDLRAMGLRPGDQVGIEVRRDRYTHLLLILACQQIGAAVMSLTREEMLDAGVLARACRLLLTAAPADPMDPGRVRVIPPGWARRAGASGRQGGWVFPAPDPTLVASIIRTSGTTGRPKTMALTQDVQLRLIQVNIVRMTQDGLMVPVSLCLYGLAVRAVLMRVLAILHLGGTIIFGHEDQAQAALAGGLVNQAMFTVGDMERIIRRTTRPPAGHEVHVELFGSAVGAGLRQTIRERLTERVRTRYSSNETGTIADMDATNVGTLGDGVEVRIVDEAERDLPLGMTGLIRVRTPTMVQHYLGDPEATRATFVDGWFRTNDLGFMPAVGQLVVLGRADDVLNIGGVKLAPAPLEDEMRRIPGVSDAALLEVPDRRQVGHLIVAIEVPDGLLPDGVVPSIEAILRHHVRHYRIVPLVRFPRTGTAKVRRAELVAMLARALTPGPG